LMASLCNVTSARRLSLAVVLVFVVGGAQAADMPVKAPVFKAVAPAFTWSGFYIGVNGGYSYGPWDSESIASIFATGERVDIIGTGRGKGFQGVMKRHNFGGGANTHGSMFHRAPGSIGASSFPSRVVKGMRMGGRMGGGRTTVHNLKVLSVDLENNLLIVEGGIPGSPSSYVVIRKALKAKRIKVAQVEKPKKGKK